MQKFTAFDLDEFVAGKSKSWTFWNCDPSEFPWSYAKDEYAYVIAGQFYVTYDGALPYIVSLTVCPAPLLQCCCSHAPSTMYSYRTTLCDRRMGALTICARLWSRLIRWLMPLCIQ